MSNTRKVKIKKAKGKWHFVTDNRDRIMLSLPDFTNDSLILPTYEEQRRRVMEAVENYFEEQK